MTADGRPVEALLRDLRERAKELNCLYRVDEILSRSGLDLGDALDELVRAIPAGWQYPAECQARIVLEGRAHESPRFAKSASVMQTPIVSEGETIGQIAVSYTEPKPDEDEGPFLKEERRLIKAIAERIGYHIMQRRLTRAVAAARYTTADKSGKWSVILDFLRGADRTLLRRITRRMINHLCWSGVSEAEALLSQHVEQPDVDDATPAEDNRPQGRAVQVDLDSLAERTFALAADHLAADEIVRCIETWITEDKASFLYAIAERLDAPLTDLAAAVDRFHRLHIDETALPEAQRRGLRVALIRRFFSDQLDYIKSAQHVTRLSDFHDFGQRLVLTPESRGKLGGKSAGLFLASRIVRDAARLEPILGEVRVPKTWYIPSDILLEFLRFNNMQDVYDRKYRDIELIRQDYPYLVQAFKATGFPSDVTNALAAALDDFGDRPIIVRSSSLLEDRTGSAFSGKYKSLFLGNQGTKRERLVALQDAIAEVYASVFSPDPIEYRAERGLLDVHEEMGVMIQEVVGTRVGPYFLPAYSGVAYSHNEFRWSSRIRREDGLVRIVPGLGTRAVDRLSDDYPVLVSPGQPGLRVNATPEEIIRYSPTKIDVINLETNGFETANVHDLLRRYGDRYPAVQELVADVRDGLARRPVGRMLDFTSGEYAVTFDGLITRTPFVPQIRTLLSVLQERIGVPVDIEFASDGKDLYLLQCRAQGHGPETGPTPIPHDIPKSRVLFTARRYVSNGRVPDITHVVYVDETAYHALPTKRHMQEVGETVGRLNRLLPKRQFILMGPGRWGSRGDITLGVSVTYSQINNTAVLIEIARQKGNYVPDLSFGTHFFQDLVETGIRYLPLYPDDEDVHFDETFFRNAHNMLTELLPDAAHVADTVRVIDVSRETNGKVLRILMNAEVDEAVGLLSTPSGQRVPEAPRMRAVIEPSGGDHWRWRARMAERIAASVDAERFGVTAMYLIGSTKNYTAAPSSDLDLIVHVTDDERKRPALSAWLDGWSRALAEMNYLRTGYRSEGLLDVQFVTDADIADQTSFAAKIGAPTDAARPLPLAGAKQPSLG